MKAPLAERVLSLPNARLAGDGAGKRYAFNPSLARWRGDLHLAYRANDFRDDATIHLCRLGDDFLPLPGSHRPFRPALLPGQFVEDPRLFVFREELYCACTLLGMQGQVQSQALWRIDGEGRPLARVPLPYGRNRNLNDHAPGGARPDGPFHPFSTEKNWQFFDHAGRLHFVHAPQPHTVVAWDLEAGRPAAVHKTRTRFPWAFGTPRGGTPPVRVGDEYFSFLHARHFPQPPPFPAFTGAVYGATLYAFAARPPFRPTRWVPFPLVEGDPFAPRTLFGSAVAYPAGALFEDGRWIVSCGVNDRESALAFFDHELLLQKSVRL